MKKKLRQYYKKVRAENKNYDDIFIDRLLEIIVKFSNIAFYIKIDNEVDLKKMISMILPFKNLYLPVVNGKNLEFHKFTSFDNLSLDDMNILSPKNEEIIAKNLLDCIIIPCIAANFKGYRLGYGKGYYDKFLNDYQGLKIGIVYENCLTTVDFQDEFDIPLDILVTEKRIIYVKEGK